MRPSASRSSGPTEQMWPPSVPRFREARGSTDARVASSLGHRTKSREDVAPLGHEVVAIARVHHDGCRGRTSAPQHATAAEPGLGIVTVGVGHKAGIGFEAAGRPLPHLAPAHVGLRQCGALPFSFGWQAAPGPAAPGLGIVTTQMHGWGLGLQRPPLAKVLLLPGATMAAHMRGQGVACSLRKRKVTRPGDGCSVHAKSRQRHRLLLQLVVEMKACVTAAKPPSLCGHFNVCGGLPLRGGHVAAPSQVVRHGHLQRLRHVDSSFVVHGLMKQHQTPEVKGIIVAARLRQQIQGVGLYGRQVALGGFCAGQGQVPARSVGHGARIKQRIGAWQVRRVAHASRVGPRTACALGVAGNPPLLKPADVAQLPERRVEFSRVPNSQRGQGMLPSLQQAQCARTRGLQCGGQRRGVAFARGAGG